MNINDRLFGSPISGRVRAELDKRQQSTVGTTETDDPYAPISDTTVTPKYDLSERNPFVRMWTSVKLIDPGLVEEKIILLWLNQYMKIMNLVNLWLKNMEFLMKM